MLNSASNPPIADCRARQFLVAFAWVTLALLVPLSAWAGRAVRIYEVQVKGEATAPAVQEAMRRVLVRATGRREAASDPSLAPLVTDAARFVQSSRRTAGGDTQVVFDGAALAQAVSSAGRSVWDNDRPFTLVVFYPPLGGAAADAARLELEKTAESRGLPISLAPVPVVDANGAELSREMVLQGAQRLGGDAVLIGKGESAALNGVWQWTLQTNFATDNWNGALDAGVNGAVDALARVQDSSASLAELETFVQVAGVTALNDYAAVGRLLEGIPGTRRVTLSEANGGTATFSILVRGGAEAVGRALNGSARLARAGDANGQLVYEYKP
ncbi:MAG: DUF2066 domain-containing protein [Gammaproteobacteria bacterium]